MVKRRRSARPSRVIYRSNRGFFSRSSQSARERERESESESKKAMDDDHWFICMTMSNTNTNVRSIRDQFQQPHQANLTKTRQEQKHDIVFPCSHCGRHQTISLLLQSNETRGLSWTERALFDRRRELLEKFYVLGHLDIEINAPVRRIYSQSS